MKRIITALLCVLVMCFTAGCGDEYELEDGFEETARDFADMLPLTVGLWHPLPGFARAFDLPEHIPRYVKAGYEYELGSLAYWYEGPSIALIYQASRDRTVVPVVPIGKITSDVSVFEEYGETITIELAEELPGEETGEE